MVSFVPFLADELDAPLEDKDADALGDPTAGEVAVRRICISLFAAMI